MGLHQLTSRSTWTKYGRNVAPSAFVKRRMKTTRHHYARNALGVCGLLFAARIGKAQTHASDLAAYNALIVAPVGALPALALDDGHARPDREALAVSYGQWRFDIDDAIHHSIGLTTSELDCTQSALDRFTARIYYTFPSCDR
jgi:hypothetical protein